MLVNYILVCSSRVLSVLDGHILTNCLRYAQISVQSTREWCATLKNPLACSQQLHLFAVIFLISVCWSSSTHLARSTFISGPRINWPNYHTECRSCSILWSQRSEEDQHTEMRKMTANKCNSWLHTGGFFKVAHRSLVLCTLIWAYLKQLVSTWLSSTLSTLLQHTKM